MTFASMLRGTASAIILSAAAAGAAHAQSASVEEVVVTGSRLESPGFQAPTPVTSLNAQSLQASDPRNVANALNVLPQFKGSIRPEASTSSAIASFGANNLNLRNLGPQRLLVLLDGQRVVASSTNGAIDINLIPQELIRRVDIITGGASAAYGSDAVAGVVNFILDRKLEGLRVSAQGGLSTYGDSGSYRASVAGGSRFLEGRGHLVFAGEVYNIDPIDLYSTARGWWNKSYGLIPTGATSGPTQAIVSGVTFSKATYGGLINSGPLRGTAFGPDGSPTIFNFGTLVGPNFMVGGDGVQPVIVQTAGVQRRNLFAHANYQVSDNLKLGADVQFSTAETRQTQYPLIAASPYPLVIFAGNPYIPAAVASRMASQNIASFPLGKLFSEFPGNHHSQSDVRRYAVSASGSVGGGWSYKASYSRGENDLRVEQNNNINLTRLTAAADAVVNPANGQVVCRATLSGLFPGCVPLNPFGTGRASAASIAYFTGTSSYKIALTQDVVDFALNGDLPFDFGAGPISAAVGGGYRKETSKQTSDAVAQSRADFTGLRGGPAVFNNQIGGWFVGNVQPLAGSYDLREGFAEIGVPVLKDAPLAVALDLNGAVRLTDYSTSGTVTTWKLGASYQPIEDIRLRITRSRDIRAANAVELFTGLQRTQLGNIVDVRTGASIPINAFIGGNPKLDPEKANTLTYGVVYQPSWLPGFSASVDWYDVKIKGLIATLSAQNTYNQCQAGVTSICAQIVDAGGGGLNVFTPFLNLFSFRSSGIDFEANYAREFAGGDLNLRLVANHVDKNVQTSVPGAPLIDNSALSGRFSGVLSAAYKRDFYTILVQERLVGKGLYNGQLVEGVNIADNDLPAVWYTDLTVTARFKALRTQNEAFVTVNNLFNKKPPPSPVPSTFMKGADGSRYDVIGRYITMGVRVQY